MNIIEKIFSLIKNTFSKDKDTKLIKQPEHKDLESDKKKFAKSLEIEKITKEEIKKEKKIETPICPGDGLGIKHKITY